MLFRKTALGVEEVRGRKAGLGMRERSVLILVNGVIPSAQLAERLGGDVQPALDLLLRQGMIEPAAPPPPSPAPLPPPPAAPLPPPAAPIPHDGLLAAVKQRAVAVLGEVYGPDAGAMAQDLLRAADVRALKSALVQLEETLVMYQGKRHAHDLMRRITGHG
ncbi:MAG: hypothetical protein KGL68_00280 [Burkholderiales bacterium]|nr:hypothetical protein [Burkholderiales bacterium]